MSTITINDVAALAGVSIKTVSRVLNDEPYVRQNTRDRVQEAVRQLHYKPNFAARALAGSRAYLIGLYFNNPSLDYVSNIQYGAMIACREAGYHLLVEEIRGSGPDLQTQADALLSTVRMDGVILTPPVCDQLEVLGALDAAGVPYVRLAPAVELHRAPYVYMDDHRAAYEMTVHLLALGHRRLGFIKGPAGHSATELRYQGFLQALRDHRIEMRPSWAQSGDFSFRSGLAAGEQLLGQTEPPTAIFASNDDMALGVMALAHRLRLDVPEDLSIAGFDDSPSAQVVWPQLTTIRQPVARMASEAAVLLIARHNESDGAPQGSLLDFELVIRGSTGPI